MTNENHAEETGALANLRERATYKQPPDTRDLWISQALPLIERIADWERTNGTASSLANDAERRGIAAIVERWALIHNARGMVEQVKEPPLTKEATRRVCQHCGGSGAEPPDKWWTCAHGNSHSPEIAVALCGCKADIIDE